LTPALAALAARKAIDFGVQCDANDHVGNCAFVGIANGARADAALRGFKVNITTPTVLGWYGRAGYPQQDNGAVLLDVLASQLGQAFMAEQQLPLCGPFATLDVRNRGLLARAMERVGWVYPGFALAVADQVADVWDINTPAAAGDPTPGSWGGHCADMLWCNGIDDDSLVFLATWGIIHPATWRWVDSRMEEAHVVIWRSVQGIDYDRLAADNDLFLQTA
jgi:hypothetical protein